MRRRVDERRRAPRSRIALPVHLDGGALGTTVDISAVGLFLRTDHPLALSDALDVSVAVNEWATEGGFRIQGQGRVVRIETEGARAGVALEVVWSEIEPLDPRSPNAPADDPD
jgi:hypothetical protein